MDSRRLEPWRLNLVWLRWAAIVLPLLFLVVVDHLRHTVLAQPLHTLPGFIATYAVATLAILAFSHSIFGVILHLQRRIGEHNRRLTAVTAVLEERERIAREMHDGMAQVLGYVNTQTLAAKKLFADGRVDEGNRELARMQETVRQLYADVREGIVGLHTASHLSHGLHATLSEYLEHYRDMASLEVQFEATPEIASLRVAPSAEIQLIRIVQEALSNVRKHAGATAVSVRLARTATHLHVEVADNGQGFDPGNLPPTGWPRFGLQTMRERAEAVGGRFAIETNPGQGTRVVVNVPLGAGG